MNDAGLTPFGAFIKRWSELKWYTAHGRFYIFIGSYYRHGFSFGKPTPPARMRHEDAVRVAEIGRDYLGIIDAALWTGRAA